MTAAFCALVVLRGLVAQMSGRTRRMGGSVAVWPAPGFYDGEPCSEGLDRHHLLEDDLYSGAHQWGVSLEGVQAVLREPNGSCMVLSESRYGAGSAVDRLR